MFSDLDTLDAGSETCPGLLRGVARANCRSVVPETRNPVPSVRAAVSAFRCVRVALVAGVVMAAAMQLGCSPVPRQLSSNPMLSPVDQKIGSSDQKVDAPDQETPQSYPSVPTDVETVPVTIGPPEDPSLDDLVYRIGPYDDLRVVVFGVEELSSTGQVNFQGLYTMPLVGAISLNRLTTAEAEAEIARVLGERYLRNPSVSVHVLESANLNITLSGKMNGSRSIKGRTTLGQMLSAAGGVPAVGKKHQVVIFRATDETRQSANPKLHAYVVDYQSILEGKLRDPLLVGNDRIYVPPSALAIFFDPWLGVFKTYAPVSFDAKPIKF